MSLLRSQFIGKKDPNEYIHSNINFTDRQKIVFVDAICFSACNLVTIKLKERGDIPIIGFGYYDTRKYGMLPIGESPTFVYLSETYYTIKSNNGKVK